MSVTFGEWRSSRGIRRAFAAGPSTFSRSSGPSTPPLGARWSLHEHATLVHEAEELREKWEGERPPLPEDRLVVALSLRIMELGHGFQVPGLWRCCSSLGGAGSTSNAGQAWLGRGTRVILWIGRRPVNT